MNKGIHRVAAGTKRARQVASQNSTKNIVSWKPPVYMTAQEREIAEWNAEVERKKAAKKAGK